MISSIIIELDCFSYCSIVGVYMPQVSLGRILLCNIMSTFIALNLHHMTDTKVLEP